MSSLYNLEPQPNASCILHTTSGDISLELWAQQTPLTSRNFLQHCLDGYYDNTTFHRLVPGFILQGGDPTNTGSGGESIYDGGAFDAPRELGGIWPQEERHGANAGPTGVGFADEFHSRLKFNRRGLLGMANEGKDSNGSQFFLTLGVTAELQGRNTLFGRVVGDTVYNLARMGEAEVEGERPLYPIVVTGVEVLVNPFKDMVRRARTAAPVVKPKESVKVKKRKGGKQLLSFGVDDEDEGVMPVLKKTKFDTRIVMDVDDDVVPASKSQKAERRSEKVIKKPVSIESSPEPAMAPPAKVLPNRAAKVESRDISSSPEPQVQKVTSLLDRTNAQIAELKASMKRNIAPVPVKEKKKSALEEMIPSTSIRGRKRPKTGHGSSATNDSQSLAILKAFQSKLASAPPEKEASNQIPLLEEDSHAAVQSNGNIVLDYDGVDIPDDEEAALCDLHFIANCQSCKSWDLHGADGADAVGKEEDDNDRAWMSHALSFKADKLGKDLSYRKKAEEELVVIDPREKARTLKEEKKAERLARSGGSGRAWDRERNEKLARTSALAGRAAR